jgi:molybdopterin converting factor small subunit
LAVVFIPAQLRELTGGDRKVNVAGATLREVIDNLDAKHPGLKARLLDDEGAALNPYIEIAVGDEIATLGLLTPVPKDAEVHILPNVSGGAAKPHGGDVVPGPVRRRRASG